MISKCNCIEITAELVIESTHTSRIILDIREPMLFEKSHIKDSINLLTSSLLLRRLQRGSLTISSLLPENVVLRLENDLCDSIVLCDENSSTQEMSRNLSIIVNAMKKSYPNKNIYFLESKYFLIRFVLIRVSCFVWEKKLAVCQIFLILIMRFWRALAYNVIVIKKRHSNTFTIHFL